MRLTVMTFNIRLGIQEGIERIAAVVASANPDLIALQEVGRHWTMGPVGDSAAFVAARAGLAHIAFAPTIERFGPAHYGHALLSRWPLVKPKLISLPRHIDEPRALLYVEVQTPDGTLNVLSTHLSHVDDRQAQGRMLDSLSHDLADPALILGDLNESESKEWLDRLSERFEGVGATGPTFPAHEPTRCIDYILSRGLSRNGTRILEATDASDHHAVIASFDWFA